MTMVEIRDGPSVRDASSGRPPSASVEAWARRRFSGDVLGTVTALRTSSIMARAISNSPMITVEAPCFFK